MNISKVKADIKSGTFDNFYIFGVEEGYVAKQYVNMIAKKSGYNLEYADSVSDVYSKLKVKSIIPVHTVYVVLDDKEFLNSKYESRWNTIESNIQDDILIVEYTNVDKRVKFWKHFKDKAVMFEKLTPRLLIRHIQKEIDLSEENCNKLIEICENDLGRILLEVDKIKHMELSSNLYPNNIFKRLVKEGAIYVPPKDAIFDFVNAVLDNDIVLAYELLEDCYAVGEANMVLISVLYTSFRNLLQVQSSGDNISKSTGLTGWQIKNVKPYVNIYTDEEIIDILQLLQRVERGIKIGYIPESISIEYVLANVFMKGE